MRVLADVGGLSIAQIKVITGALDGRQAIGPGELERLASYSIGADGLAPESVVPAGGESSATERALADARHASDAFVDTLGFTVDAASPARAELAEALHALRLLGFADDPIVFYEHARLAYELGSFEIASAGSGDEPTVAVEHVMVGSVIFGAAFMALRRMAHEHETRRRYSEASTGDESTEA